MKNTHITRSKTLSGTGTGLFFLPNRKGGYVLLGDNGFSHYCGVCHFLPDDWTLYKTIDNISLDVSPDEVVNKFSSVLRSSGQSTESFFTFGRTLFYDVKDYSGGITIDLDMRRIHDEDDQDRIYKIYYENGAVVVEYRHFGEAYYLIIRGAHHYSLLNEWQPRKYRYDALRKYRSDRWVYRALRFDCADELSLSFTFGRDREQALSLSEADWENRESILSKVKSYTRSVKTDDSVELSAAVFALENSLVTLNHDVNRSGLFAGFPWFFQFWSRDELVSLQGLVLAEKYSLVKDILARHVSHLAPDGRLPNMVPSSALGSADAVLWLWKRLGDFVSHLESRKLLWQYYSAEELDYFVSRLEFSLHQIRERFEVGGLICNGDQETWMDSLGPVNDRRGGARIEIQALMLSSVRTLLLLYKVLKRGNGKSTREYEKSLVEAVRKKMFNGGGVLFDGLDDPLWRSNLFIAAYAYPEMLSKKEWVAVFRKALQHLWCEWGGLSSIDKRHPWFTPFYDPLDNRSYHRGDSWYWVNNLAALAMKRIAPEEFSFHIAQIQKASVHDLLWGGAVGGCSEVSSAQKQESFGCLVQTWSAATLVELLDEK